MVGVAFMGRSVGLGVTVFVLVGRMVGEEVGVI